MCVCYRNFTTILNGKTFTYCIKCEILFSELRNEVPLVTSVKATVFCVSVGLHVTVHLGLSHNNAVVVTQLYVIVWWTSPPDVVCLL